MPQQYRDVAAFGKTWATEDIEYEDNTIKGAFELHAFQIAPNTMVAAFVDITERKRSELELKQSEEKYRTLFEAASDGIFIQDGTGFRDCNNRGAEMYGLPKEKIIGRSPAEFAPERQPDGRLSAEVAGEKIQAALNGFPQVFEWQPMRVDGSLFDVEVTLSRLELEGSLCLQAIVRDITERKRAANALKESEERFRAITMTASDAILLMDDRGKIVHWNPAAERIFHYSTDEAIGKDLHIFLAPQRLHKDYLKGFENFVKTGQGPVINRSVEIVAMKKDGMEFPIEISTSAMNIGGRWHALGIIRDITERKKLEQEIIKTQKLESIGTLAGGIAHDFNNLLQGVFGYISMAKMTLDQKEKSLAMLEQAEEALHMSVNLTAQLLTFSKGGKPVKKLIRLEPAIENV